MSDLDNYKNSDDPNYFWRLSSGQHEKLLDEAIEYGEKLKEENAELREINKQMHTQIAGYLFGDDWDHWVEYNKARFEI